MALTPKDNEAFFREVDEELRRAQMTGFAQRYGKIVVAVILLLLAGVGAFLWWQNRQEVQAGEQAEEFTAMLDDVEAGKIKGVDARLDSMAKEGTDGYRAAALLTKADLAIQAEKDGEAVALFKKIAADEDLARPYRDLALVRQTALEFDKLAPAVVIERLKPLAVKGNPWFGSAGEMVAISYMKQQKPELAGRLFADMSKDEKVPRSIRSRAEAMAGALGVEAVPDKPAVKGAVATKEGTQ